MDANELIAQLGERLDEWLQVSGAGLGAMDKAAQTRALLQGIEIVKDLDRLKAESFTALKLLLNQQASMPEEERVATLVRAFVLAAKLKGALTDELSDTPGQHEAVGIQNSVADILDTVGAGNRAALAPLLEDADARVRASAGAYLINLMPDRVLPVLREVEETEHANSAHFTAMNARVDWQFEHGINPFEDEED